MDLIRKKILIAEDDFYLGKIMQTTLMRAYTEVDRINDGDKVMEAIKDKHYDLILLDMMMPVRSGIEVLKWMKRNKIKIPAIVFSNAFGDDLKDKALALGAKAYYVKSDMNVDMLLEAVQKHLKA